MNWIVVNTKSNCENKAALNLKKQGFCVFFPKIKKKYFVHNKFQNLRKPLFPGYIFVNLKKNKDWLKINYTYGVLKILQFSETPYILPFEILDNIKKKCDHDHFFSNDLFKKGEKVLINKFKNTGLDAIFEEYIDERRSYVFLEFLKQEIKTKVDNKYLEKIS